MGPQRRARANSEGPPREIWKNILRSCWIFLCKNLRLCKTVFCLILWCVFLNRTRSQDAEFNRHFTSRRPWTQNVQILTKRSNPDLSRPGQACPGSKWCFNVGLGRAYMGWAGPIRTHIISQYGPIWAQIGSTLKHHVLKHTADNLITLLIWRCSCQGPHKGKWNIHLQNHINLKKNRRRKYLRNTKGRFFSGRPYLPWQVWRALDMSRLKLLNNFCTIGV